jgi:hypothetical protein|tara:strand:+ start:905 stop:1489 length:585 start_codon:yes stop_codon:yes gene_type:complete
MTLFSESKSNSVVAKYDGDKLDIFAMNDDGENKKIYITQLTAGDIMDMIARPANSNSLDKRLSKDFGPQPRTRYPKKLQESLKINDMISSVPSSRCKQTKRKKKRPKITSRTRNKRRKRKTRNTRRNIRKVSPSKTMRYTPYPSSSDSITKVPSSVSNKTVPVDRLSEQMPETIRKLISNASRDNNTSSPLQDP